MADQYDVTNLGAGGSGAINPGSAAYFAFQRELMRRQQDAAAKAAVARQADIDKLNAEATRANITNTTEATRSLVDQRAAAAQKVGLENATTGLTPGTVLAPEQSAAIRKSGGAALILGKPATPAMTMGIPSEFAAAPEGAAAASEVPVTPASPATEEYKGTAQEQTLKRYQDFAEKTAKALNEKQANGEELTPVEQEALFQANSISMTGKSSTLPAGVVVPKGAGADTSMNTPEKKYLGLISKQDSGTALTSDEASYVKHYKDQHPDAATTAAAAAAAAATTADRSDARLAKQQLFTAKQTFRKELLDNEKVIDKDVERSDRALALLNSPNFVTDAVAGPEFLQIVAGGMGSGLRMTDAELRRINEAQTKIDQWKGALAKWGVLPNQERVTIQAEMRAQMQSALQAVHAARQRKSKLASSALSGLDSVTDQSDLDKYHAKYWEDRVEAGAMSNAPGENAPKAAGLPPGVTVTKRR